MYSRPFIDIQLKSFHKDDKKMATQWPPKQAPNGQSMPGTLPECSIQVGQISGKLNFHFFFHFEQAGRAPKELRLPKIP